MVPVCSSIMLELVLAVHSYHVIAYPVSSLLCLKSCFLYKSDCAAFGTAVEQIRRVFDNNSKIIFVHSP